MDKLLTMTLSESAKYALAEELYLISCRVCDEENPSPFATKSDDFKNLFRGMAVLLAASDKHPK